MMRNKCEHGYGGFFKCPQGCHKGNPVADYEELDRNIDYFHKRLKAHGLDNPEHDKDQRREPNSHRKPTGLA